MRAVKLTVAALVAALGFPAGATAVECAPPGNSGVNEYFETIPGASCNVPPPGSGAGGSGAGGGHAVGLAPGQRRQLAAQGPAGRAVARFVAATAPPIAGTAASHRVGSGRGSHGAGATRPPAAALSAAPPTASGQSPVAGLLKPIVSGSAPGGTGVALPIVLGAALLLAVAVALRKLWMRS